MILIERWLLHRGLMMGWGILILLFQHPQISQKFPYIPTCARCKLDFDNRATLISWRTKSATRMMITSSQEWYLSSQEIRLVLILESYFHLLMPGDSEMQGNPSSHTYPRQMQIFPPQCQQLVHRRINLNPSRKFIAQDTHGQKFTHTHTQRMPLKSYTKFSHQFTPKKKCPHRFGSVNRSLDASKFHVVDTMTS